MKGDLLVEQKKVLQFSAAFMYEQLVKYIKKCERANYTETSQLGLEAYLSACIHAFCDYFERYGNSDEYVAACRFVNNTIKHNAGYITYEEISGGMEFPTTFPIEIEPIRIVWKRNPNMQTYSEKQNNAYKKVFEGEEIVPTLKCLYDRIRK